MSMNLPIVLRTTSLGISARAWHRVLRVARTIADLAGDERVGRAHLAEALGFRRALVGVEEGARAHV